MDVKLKLLKIEIKDQVKLRMFSEVDLSGMKRKIMIIFYGLTIEIC